MNDEAELARELAVIEAELEDLPAPQMAEASQTEAPLQLSNEGSEYTSGAEDLTIEPAAEMDRIIDQTSSELEEPDGKKRRNALGHLRAAVASARADKTSNPQKRRWMRH